MKNDNMGEKGGRSNERMGAGNRNEQTGQRTGETNRQAGSERSGGSVSLTSEQKTKIRTTVLEKGPKVDRSKVSFNIAVGTTVPRSSVHFVTVPATLVEIYPQWRGYDYFVVGEEIVIVDPHTLQIVAVLEV
jgi:hypothetical protein